MKGELSSEVFLSNFFIHYKNKPYKYLDQVRHSETLEELVLYETRYENENGKLWVRPKEMFFENVMVDGQTKPRFEKIKVEYRMSESLTAKDKTEILQLLNLVFGKYSQEKFESTLSNRTKVFLVSAYIADRFIGFKVGYTYNSDRFYSWLGAVDPDFRGLGIGRELMELQHKWCQDKQFKIIETRTKNKWQAMLILNIKCGFNIVGTYTNSSGQTKIIMEKSLLNNLKAT